MAGFSAKHLENNGSFEMLWEWWKSTKKKSEEMWETLCFVFWGVRGEKPNHSHLGLKKMGERCGFWSVSWLRLLKTSVQRIDLFIGTFLSSASSFSSFTTRKGILDHMHLQERQFHVSNCSPINSLQSLQSKECNKEETKQWKKLLNRIYYTMVY